MAKERNLLGRGRGWWRYGLSLVFAALVDTPVVAPASAEEPPVYVDLELVLAVDISDSMSPAELQLQRDGYVNAFRHPEIVDAIRSGGIGRIAVLYLEWAGAADQRVGIPWTILGQRQDALSFADSLAALPVRRGSGTSISAGLLRAEALFAVANLRGSRNVIDISGDGVNNFGPPLVPVRNRLISEGIIINGLPIALSVGAGQEAKMSFSRPILERYYRDCVIGGPGAFAITVEDTALFEAAIRRKLVMEIAGRPAKPAPVGFKEEAVRTRIDCAALWEQPGR